MTLGDGKATRARRPWTFAGVCIMVVSMALLLFGLTQVPPIQLLPGYVVAHLLIGACIFGPIGKMSSRQAAAFLIPGLLLAVLALLNLGFWAGGWLIGLPTWGLLLSQWTPENPLSFDRLLKFLGLLVLGLVIFTFNAIYPVLGLGLVLLPVFPLVRLASPNYRTRALQTAVELVLGVVAVVLALAIPTPEGSWSSPWTIVGGAATVGLVMAYWARQVPQRTGRLQPHY
ncbi:hypothetical protein [Arthrobacter sp. LFS091]|uniref:hypothetical protein n=1 Tax=Arthrobacter sp. LFS091 TaxID=3229892 RepID=UPI003A80339B